jgi:hypothetical protein
VFVLFVCLFVLIIHRLDLAWNHAKVIYSNFSDHFFAIWLDYIHLFLVFSFLMSCLSLCFFISQIRHSICRVWTNRCCCWMSVAFVNATSVFSDCRVRMNTIIVFFWLFCSQICRVCIDFLFSRSRFLIFDFYRVHNRKCHVIQMTLFAFFCNVESIFFRVDHVHVKATLCDDRKSYKKTNCDSFLRLKMWWRSYFRFVSFLNVVLLSLTLLDIWECLYFAECFVFLVIRSLFSTFFWKDRFNHRLLRVRWRAWTATTLLWQEKISIFDVSRWDHLKTWSNSLFIYLFTSFFWVYQISSTSAAYVASFVLMIRKNNSKNS